MQFLKWLGVAVFSFSAFAILAFLVFGVTQGAITGATLFVYGSALLLARWRTQRGDRLIPLVIVCGGFFVASLFLAAFQPGLQPVLILAPLLALGVGLPYAGERALRYLFVGTWFVAMAVALIAEAAAPWTQSPSWFDSVFRLCALGTALAIVLLLLWQYRGSLVGALEQAKEAEEQATYEATHDWLTGLPNRSLFTECLERTLERAKKDRGYLFAVLFMDLDRFKYVNDSLGHSYGDRLLAEVAHRLESCIHHTDTVARLGGDEFTVLLENLRSPEDANLVIERIQRILQEPLMLDEHVFYVTVSIGVVKAPCIYPSAEELLRDADTAMYEAKERGKNRSEMFSEEMHEGAVHTLNLEKDLRRAVARGEFSVRYQPIVCLRSGRLTGFEALARWEHPELGLRRPSEFIPLAEELGLIAPIGLSVLEQACHDTARWLESYPDQRPLTVSVNLSAQQLGAPGLAEQVDSVLRKSGLAGRHLHLEVTEVAIIQDATLAKRELRNLRSLGVRISLDDFGTGYSSLSLLHELPADTLKIDRSFIHGMEDDPERAQLVRTINTLGQELGMDVVAEGVEELGQVEILRNMGCDYVQGYLFSRPVDSSSVRPLITADTLC